MQDLSPDQQRCYECYGIYTASGVYYPGCRFYAGVSRTSPAEQPECPVMEKILEDVGKHSRGEDHFFYPNITMKICGEPRKKEAAK